MADERPKLPASRPIHSMRKASPPNPPGKTWFTNTLPQLMRNLFHQEAGIPSSQAVFQDETHISAAKANNAPAAQPQESEPSKVATASNSTVAYKSARAAAVKTKRA